MGLVKKVYLGDKLIRPNGRKPGSNTLLYMPLNGDFKDYSGNNNNGSAYNTVNFGNVGDRQYAILNNSAIALTSFPVGTGNPNDFTFAGWAKLDSSNGKAHTFYMGYDSYGQRFNLILNYKDGSYYRHIMDLYQYNSYLGPMYNTSPSNPGEWVCVIMTYQKSSQTLTLYINNELSGSSNSYSLNIGSSFKYIGRADNSCAYGLAEIVFENGIWDEQDRENYYNGTSSYFK